MNDPHPLRAFIDACNDAWNRHDVDVIVSMHTADSVFCNHTSGGEAVGHAAVRRIVADVFRTFPDIAFRVRRLYVRDDLIVQEWTASATHRNPVSYRNRVLAPTGKRIEWDGMDIIPVHEGKVARKDVYANSMDYLRQLGASI